MRIFIWLTLLWYLLYCNTHFVEILSLLPWSTISLRYASNQSWKVIIKENHRLSSCRSVFEAKDLWAAGTGSARSPGRGRLQAEQGSSVSSTDVGREALSPGDKNLQGVPWSGTVVVYHTSPGLPEIFNILSGLGLRLFYKLDMLIFIIIVIISILFECCASHFIHIISFMTAVLCSRGVITCILLIRGPRMSSGAAFWCLLHSGRAGEPGQLFYFYGSRAPSSVVLP